MNYQIIMQNPMDHHHLHLLGEQIGPLTFFIAGLAGSLHCLGMCGPLSSLFLSKDLPENTLFPLIGYHSARCVSYLLMAILISLLGQTLENYTSSLIPLIIVVAFLWIYAFGIPLKMPSFLSAPIGLLMRRAQQQTPTNRGILLGTLTPLLPCGLLYGVLAGLLLAPSVTTAMGWMFSFTLGTIPLLLMAQSGYFFWVKKTGAFTLGTRTCAFLAGTGLIVFHFFH